MKLPQDVQNSIERFFALYGTDVSNPEMMADSFTGCGRGAYDGTTYTPYPAGTYDAALDYILQRTAKQEIAA